MTGNTAMADNTTDDKPPFREHRVPRGQGSIYARDYKGAGPAFVLMPVVAIVISVFASLVGLRRAVGVDPALAFG